MKFKSKLRPLVIVVFSLFFLLIANGNVSAETCDEKYNCENIDKANAEYSICITEQKRCWEEKISEAQRDANTLQSAIGILDGQIRVQALQIQQTVNEINQLEKEITELSQRIEGLSISLDKLSGILIERIRQSYKQSRTQFKANLFVSNSFNQFISQNRYLSEAQNQTLDVMKKTELQRATYDQQKTLKEEKQAEVAQKRNELQAQKATLDAQKSSKDILLTQTKNNEAVYQQKLAEAIKELTQIANAANTVIREGNGIQVNRGEVVGTMGNSGYSTGAHLHFGVYKYSVEQFTSLGNWDWYYSSTINPLDKLKNKNILWSTACSHDPSGYQNSGNGDWEWPMASIRVTQNYGSNTCYNWMYGGRTHPALDLVAIGDISVRSVENGEAYFCRNCLGDGGNGVFIFHDGGYMTLYWHLK